MDRISGADTIDLGGGRRDQAGGGLTTQPSAWAQSELPTSRLPDIGL